MNRASDKHSPQPASGILSGAKIIRGDQDLNLSLLLFRLLKTELQEMPLGTKQGQESSKQYPVTHTFISNASPIGPLWE